MTYKHLLVVAFNSKGGLVSKKNWGALRASVWSKNQGGLPWIRHCWGQQKGHFGPTYRNDPTGQSWSDPETERSVPSDVSIEISGILG